jgi:hypothetical protein
MPQFFCGIFIIFVGAGALARPHILTHLIFGHSYDINP